MSLHHTHTFAELEVSPVAYAEIRAKLEEAGYQHAFVDGAIDMHGIGLTCSAEASIDDLFRVEQWHEDDGVVLWWPAAGEPGEPPYCGTPLDENYPEHMTRWSRIHEPRGL